MALNRSESRDTAEGVLRERLARTLPLFRAVDAYFTSTRPDRKRIAARVDRDALSLTDRIDFGHKSASTR